MANRRAPAAACMRRQWDSNSSTHGPASRPWRLRTISDVDSIVSIFNMSSGATVGDLATSRRSQLLPCSALEKRPDPSEIGLTREPKSEPVLEIQQFVLALTFQVQSSSRDGIIES